MHGVKCWFFCGENHLSKKCPGREEVLKTIEQLKAKHPTAFLTVEDLAKSSQMDKSEQGEGTDRDLDSYVE